MQIDDHVYRVVGVSWGPLSFVGSKEVADIQAEQYSKDFGVEVSYIGIERDSRSSFG